MYNITPAQKELLIWLVQTVKKGELEEMFAVQYPENGGVIFKDHNRNKHYKKNLNRVQMIALSTSEFLVVDVRKIYTFEKQVDEYYTLTGKAYEAIDSNFAEPDTSFIKYISSFPDITNLDKELKSRCLPTLGAGSADPKLWDSAVRTAVVILEERLRDIGQVTNPMKVGKDLVGEVFRQNGPLALKLTSESERISYRDLFLGIIGTFRNPYAHRLIDPTPENGGTVISFINFLLNMLEDLRRT